MQYLIPYQCQWQINIIKTFYILLFNSVSFYKISLMAKVAFYLQKTKAIQFHSVSLYFEHKFRFNQFHIMTLHIDWIILEAT